MIGIAVISYSFIGILLLFIILGDLGDLGDYKNEIEKKKKKYYSNQYIYIYIMNKNQSSPDTYDTYHHPNPK